MTEERRSKKTDLVLSNGEYAFTQDLTTGVVKVLTGPTVVNVTGQEYPVLYDQARGRFLPVDLADAACESPMAAQGFYVELHNPPATDSGAQPMEGGKEMSPALLMGRRVNLPGPTTFSLWPRQVAKVIEGHHLRSNQYLLGRVYDEEAAKENWAKAVLKVATGAGAAVDDAQEGTIGALTEEDLSVGKLFVIKGTDVSFYIPPTGVEVVPDEAGRFVREALTLERLQYCILVDENGDKDYQRGPKVVFPKPTQRFYADPKTGAFAFRPTELNEKQGILVKVIASYEEGGRAYQVGEELFITGADTPIYVPRPEHSLVRYDGNAKHFATAVPAGEARYVMDRGTGVIRTVRGPTMLLPDPRHEVIVRRVLSDRECKLFYPGNDEVRAYNHAVRKLVERKPSTRGAVSEGEISRGGRGGGKRRVVNKLAVGHADVSSVHSGATGMVADEWSRAATYSEPRTLTLNTKFAGAPVIHVWPGYAVMVVNKSGERRAVLGPASVLLEYDETLVALRTSTGLPKRGDERDEVVFVERTGLRVTDRVVVRSREDAAIALELTLNLRFEGEDALRWFAVDDFVGYACGEVRLRLKAAARAHGVEALYADPAAIVHAAVVGDGEGLALADNASRVVHVDLTSTKVVDDSVRELLASRRREAIEHAVSLGRAQAQLALERETQAIERERLGEQAQMSRRKNELMLEAIAQEASVRTATVEAALAELAKKLEEQTATDAIADARQGNALVRQRRSGEVSLAHQAAEQALALEQLDAATRAAVARFDAAQGPLAEAITMLGNQQVLATVAEAVSAQRLFGGKNVADVVGNLFEGTRLAETFARIERGAAPLMKLESEE